MKKVKPFFDLVFVVVTYKNAHEIINLLISLRNNILVKYKIIVVNSFYNSKTNKSIKKTAIDYNCDFIKVKNLGYGYGNNIGCNLALKSYEFNHVIITNPDIEILSFDGNLTHLPYEVIAPEIITKSNRKQNPYLAYKPILIELFYYYYCLTNIKLFKYISSLANYITIKLFSIIIIFKKKSPLKIYAGHGSFLIIKKTVLTKINSLFNPKMFLFAEENYLSNVLYKHKVETYYINTIKVLHNENSKKSTNLDFVLSNSKKSFITYYVSKND